ncbi:MAG TPA: streptolysin associated protein SagC [Clostridia bacterium]|nr:streptolysin associated protein SagC [Clostridia bacterium]
MYNSSFKYTLADNVRVYSNGDNEYRIRKGIWNYEEAGLTLDAFNKNMRDALVKIFNDMDEGIAVDIFDVMEEMQLTQDEKNLVERLMLQLQEQNYVVYENDDFIKQLLYSLIGGSVINQFAGEVNMLKPVLFFADTEYIRDYAQTVAKQMSLPLTVMGEKEYKDLCEADLTTRFDAYDTKQKMEEFQKFIEPFYCIVGSFERPHINFLRNLNRLLVDMSKPLTLSMMDGPFLSLLTIKPTETGCIECFENRVLARMQEMSAYRKFVAHTRKYAPMKEKTYASPIIQAFTSLALFEGFLLSAIGRSKLAGRVLNMYIPIMEIQIQDLMRVPFCPACGFIAQAEMEEMYTSSKKIVGNIINKIMINNEI